MPTKITIPTEPSELEDLLADPKRMKDIFANKDSFKEFIGNYANAVSKKDDNITQQVREQTQLALAEWTKENKVPLNKSISLNMNPMDGMPAEFQPQKNSARRALYNQAAPGAKADKLFDSPAQFFQAVWHGRDRLPNSETLNSKLDELRKIQNSFGSTVPADGGFLIPEVLRSQLLSLSLENAVVRPRATVIPMDSLRVPIPANDVTTNASSVFGGMIFYWTEEGAALTESNAKFKLVVLDAKKLTGYSVAPSELIADAPAFMAFINSRFPEGLAYYEDIAFMTGTGVGEPLGWMNNDATVSVAAESGQTTGTIVWENIVKMYSRMLPQSLNTAVWVASPDSFPELATMALSVGTGGSAIWLNNGAAGPPMTILGRPVIFSEKAKTIGTTGDISFVDLSYYLIGDRQTMRAESSDQYKFANDQVAFRIIERVDGRPWLSSAITPQNGSSNTLSAFVQLATR
jgi:HK97 family phage major capsid protein